jgi:hypothetical protein
MTIKDLKRVLNGIGVLFVIPCCKTKKPHGILRVPPSNNGLPGQLSGVIRSRFYEARRRAARLLRGKMPVKGTDFGAAIPHEALYRPAHDRYCGKLYKKRAIQAMLRGNQQPPVLIMSALYGLLSPDEEIQDYDLKMAGPVADLWMPHMGSLLRRAAHAKKAKVIVGFFGRTGGKYKACFDELGGGKIPAYRIEPVSGKSAEIARVLRQSLLFLAGESACAPSAEHYRVVTFSKGKDT